jgi:WD repeat-containing protein 19
VEYANDMGITKIFPNLSGTRIVCITTKGHGYFFETANESMQRVAGFPEKTERILWDQKDGQLFIT